ETTVEARHIVLATGARARVPAGFEPDGTRIWTYRDALVPEITPRSLVVMGAGAIGVAFASFYRTLGAEVTLVEMLPPILPLEDKDVSEAMRRAMTKQGIRILADARVAGVARTDSAVTVTVEAAGKSESISADHLLVATGISANVEELG